MSHKFNSYRYLDVLSRRLIKAWIELEPRREIPWTPLSKPLAECTVALISTAGIARKTDRPFDQEGERRNPWWGDPTYRIIPRGTKTEDIRVHHLHIDPRPGETDMNCLLPLDRLEELAQEGTIGSVAKSHYSFMGYLLDPREMIEKGIPSIIDRLREDNVDIVVLVPA